METQIRKNKLEIERYKRLEKAQLHGAIEWLCINPNNIDFEKNVINFRIPFIADIIDTKWKRYASDIFLAGSHYQLFITMMLTIISCLINYVPTLRSNTDNGSPVLAVCYVLCAFSMFLLGLKELPLILR